MLADTALLEKSASLGEVVRKLLRRKLLSRTWIGVRAPLTGTRLKAPSFFIEGEELRAFAAEKEGNGGCGMYGLEWEHDYLGARRLQGYDCWEVGRGDEVSFNPTLQDPAGVEVDEEVE